MSNSTGIGKEKNVAASALFGVAAIQMVMGGIGFLMYGPAMGVIDRVISFSGIFYIVLGIVARWARFPAALVGGALYGTFLVVQASINMDLLMTGLVFKVPIVILLVVAILFSLRAPSAANAAS